MFVLVFVIGIIFLFVKIEDRQVRKGVFKLLLWGLFLGGLFVFALTRNVAGIWDSITDSNFFNRLFEFSGTSWLDAERIEARISFLKNAYLYPFGGLHMRNRFGYAHDLLLDAYDEYGIFALLLLILILADGVKRLWIFCSRTSYGMVYKLGFLCIYAAILIEFCVEPIFAGMQWLFVCYCFINGCLTGMNKNYFYLKTRSD